MKAIVIMFDSLNKRLLKPYGCKWTHTDSFQRMAEHSVKFDKCYAGSLPCMPARRELQTGRYNFLHRSWGPMEPFDDSLPENLKKNGVFTHLITDHYHYWEDGGATYHTRYSSWEIVRGQEGDPWKCSVKIPHIPPCESARVSDNWRQDWVNREYINKEEEFPLVKTFKLGEEFIDKNHDQDNWMLHLECFDPHEPFNSPDVYKEQFPHEYSGKHFDWPVYRQIQDSDPQNVVEHIRSEYAALLSMCNEYFGQLLDKIDAYDMWKDTMIIVCTDHGYMLGEHNWFGKNVMPQYDEISNNPLFVWDPRFGVKNETRNSLVQTIDLVPYIYNYFGVEIPETVMGKDISPVITSDKKIREYALFGIHGASINCTDGRYVYMCAPRKEYEDSYNYTLMCTHLKQFFTIQELHTAELVEPFSFSKGCKLLKIKKGKPKFQSIPLNFGNLLFDTKTDPEEEHPIIDTDVESRMRNIIVKALKENDAPEYLYEKHGLENNA